MIMKELFKPDFLNDSRFFWRWVSKILSNLLWQASEETCRPIALDVPTETFDQASATVPYLAAQGLAKLALKI